MERTGRGNYGRYSAMAALLVFITFLPWFSASAIHDFTYIGILGILALQMSLLLGFSGLFSLGQAAFFGLGAYTSAILTVTHGLNPWLAMVCAALLTGCVAALISIPLLRLAGFVLAVASIAFNTVFMVLVGQDIFGWTGGHQGISGVPTLGIGSILLGGSEEKHIYYLVWMIGFIIIFLTSNIARSRVGRALRSIHPFAGGSERAAQSLSISPQMFKTQLFTLCAIYCSLAGSLYAHWIGYVGPSHTSFGAQMSIFILIMAVVGGRSLWGGLIGAATLHGMTELITEVVREVAPETYGDYNVIAYGVILILVLMFLPEGLASIPHRVKRSSWFTTLQERLVASWKGLRP
jgi:branched-chain amino acid transport system permease protein